MSVRDASASRLADPALRRALSAMIRRRVPSHEVDELVQATLTDAVASTHRPDDDEALQRWVRGIARHKVADFHRHRQHDPESQAERGQAELVELEASDPHDAVDLLRWAEREMPEGNAGTGKTLEWMLREGEGEKLETIAQEEQLPAPQVRQRVARLRRHFRTRWAAQIAAAALVLGGLLVFIAVRRRTHAPATAPSAEQWKQLENNTAMVNGENTVSSASAITAPSVDPLGAAAALRKTALDKCAEKEYVACLDGLDRAAELDPAGDRLDDVQRLRSQAGHYDNEGAGKTQSSKPKYYSPPKPTAAPTKKMPIAVSPDDVASTKPKPPAKAPPKTTANDTPAAGF